MYVTINGRWRARLEATDRTAERLGCFLAELAGLHPAARMLEWRGRGGRHRSVLPFSVTLPPDPTELMTALDEHKVFKPLDGRKTHVMDWLTISSAEGMRPYLRIDLCNNRLPRRYRRADAIGLTILSGATCEKLEGIFDLARQMLLSLIRAWEPEWAAVDTQRPRTGQWHPEKPPVYNGGWLVYLDRALAARLPLSNSSPVEELDEGFLVKPAGDAFDPSSADHLAAVAKLDAAFAEFARE